jgi:hypothetical protein
MNEAPPPCGGYGDRSKTSHFLTTLTIEEKLTAAPRGGGFFIPENKLIQSARDRQYLWDVWIWADDDAKVAISEFLY